MERLKLEGEKISLLLLNCEDLELWLENQDSFSTSIKLPIDSGPIKNHLENVFFTKINNMKSDPGNDHWYSYFAIIREGTLIGMIGSKGKPDENNSIEVGYGISEKYFNNGYTTEALRLFSTFFFREHKIDAIVAETDPSNIASQKVLKNNGFKKILETDLIRWIYSGCQKKG
jgi:ribosomal-protein-alanine N-acetyltransferase